MSTESNRKSELLDTVISDRRLGDIIPDWHHNTETQTLIVQAIKSGQITYEDALNAQRIATDPFEPTNKPNFKLIPEGVVCQDCSFFNGAENYESGILKVQCVKQYSRQKVSMRIDQNSKGGAVAISGKCISTNGIRN